MDVLEDRAVVQRGPAGWSYRPTGLVELNTDKCKVLHLSQNKPMHQCRLRLTEQAAALQEGTPDPGGQVIHEPPGHPWGNGDPMLSCVNKCVSSTWWEVTDPLCSALIKPPVTSLGGPGTREMLKNWRKAGEG